MVNVRLVVDVADRFELERAVLDVEVLAEALTQAVEDTPPRPGR